MLSRILIRSSKRFRRTYTLRKALPSLSCCSFASSAGGQPAVKLNLNLKDLGKQIKKQSNFDPSVNGQHFDVAVIGGGSGGLGFVLEAQKLGLKAVVFDYVDPTLHGTKWGIGGTCVNVGCIPKKLMHQAAINREWIVNSFDYGFRLGDLNDPDDHTHESLNASFEWSRLVRNIQLHIKSINFDYVSNLKENGTPYVNCLASFHDANTLVYSSQKSIIEEYLDTDIFDPEKMGKITADKIVIAVGGRPTYLSEEACPNNHKYAITSDDLFSLKNPPKKTLIVGGGYIALECAGFLQNLGFPITLMNRTDVFLREFDREISVMITEHAKRFAGVNIMPWTLPNYIDQNDEGRFSVKYKDQRDGLEGSDEFDTILFAIGRTSNTRTLNLKKIGVETNEKNHKVKGGFKDEYEKSSIDHIYAVGDCLDGVPELTPIAQQSGKFLANRMFLEKNGQADSPSYERSKMEYNDFPTTVFTPLEYSCCGYSEEHAIKVFGEDNIQVYHSKFLPLEQTLIMRSHPTDGESLQSKGFAKIICNKKDDERVVGIHYTGPNAGEVMQGYAVAVKLGMKRRDLERTVGIHPTCAEEFIVINKTKDQDPEKTSC